MRLRISTVLTFLAFLGAVTSSHAGESLLWNPNQKRLAVLTINPAGWPSCLQYSTKLWEGHVDGNPSGVWAAGANCQGTTFYTPDNSRPTFFHDTHVGWTTADLTTYPGFDIWHLGGGWGAISTWQYLNHAFPTADPCTLRELGMLQHTFGGQSYSFRPNANGTPKKLGQYGAVKGIFTAKETNFVGPARCASFPTAYITADFLVEYRNSSGQLVHWDAIGVLVSNHNNFPPSGTVFWTDNCRNGPFCFKILYGTAIGVSQLNGSFKTISIDYKALLTQHMPPPAGFTINDAIPFGFHVYSAVRGADLDFAVRGVDVWGQ